MEIVNRKYLVAAFVLLSVFSLASLSVAADVPVAPIGDSPGGNGLYMSWTCVSNGHITKEGSCHDTNSCLHGCGTCGADDDCYIGNPLV